MAALKNRKMLVEGMSLLWPSLRWKGSTWQMWDKVVPPPGIRVVTEGRECAKPLFSWRFPLQKAELRRLMGVADNACLVAFTQ